MTKSALLWCADETRTVRESILIDSNFFTLFDFEFCIIQL